MSKQPPISTGNTQLNTFISYSRKDLNLVDALLGRFEAHCRAAGDYHIKLWRDTAILPGEYWYDSITGALKACDFGLLFTSPYFFASEFIRAHELPYLVSPAGQPLIRHKTAIPVWLRPMKLELLNTGGFAYSG